jgi:hypothetical protein
MERAAMELRTSETPSDLAPLIERMRSHVCEAFQILEELNRIGKTAENPCDVWLPANQRSSDSGNKQGSHDKAEVVRDGFADP